MRAVLFDYDGVLADSLDDMLRFAGETCAEMGFARTPTRDDLDALETMSYSEYGRRLGIPDDRVQEFARRTMARFEARPRPSAIFPGMADVVRRAAERGQVGIVTNSPSRTVLQFIEVHELGAWIDVLIPVEHPGSKADKLQAALAQLGRAPDEAAFVGDAVSDVRACLEAGLRSIAVGWGHQRLARLEASGPDHVVRSPQELDKLLERL